MVRKRVVVSGRVQGVFFREACRRRAESEGVAGWVGNRADGRVEAVFEGAPEAVERLVAWCHHGPSGAAVSEVEVTDQQPTGAQGFSAR